MRENGKGPLEQEKETIEKMINLYCKGTHKTRGQLCQECGELFSYAKKRLDSCKFVDEKPTCEKCTVHCYKPVMREKVKIVMRYAGPRMVLAHPVDAIRHMIKSNKF